MGVYLKQLGKDGLEEEELKKDKKECKKIGPCGIGKKALYLNSFFLERRYYVPICSVKRVFKRVAMSKGGFSGKGVFASIPYLVVIYDDNREIQCNFKREEQVDEILRKIGAAYPQIRLVSEAVEKRRKEREREREEALKNRPVLSPEVQKEAEKLQRLEDKLAQRKELFDELSAASRKKRMYERSRNAYGGAAVVMLLLGIAALVFGGYAVSRQMSAPVYLLVFGLAAIFLFAGGNVMPTSKKNQKAIEERLQLAVKKAEQYLGDEKDFPLPARYAHPVTLKWMREELEWGNAKNEKQALEMVKEKLKRMNAQVEVEQDEFDEIMTIKPMFLVWDYQ